MGNGAGDGGKVVIRLSCITVCGVVVVNAVGVGGISALLLVFVFSLFLFLSFPFLSLFYLFCPSVPLLAKEINRPVRRGAGTDCVYIHIHSIVR